MLSRGRTRRCPGRVADADVFVAVYGTASRCALGAPILAGGADIALDVPSGSTPDVEGRGQACAAPHVVRARKLGTAIEPSSACR